MRIPIIIVVIRTTPFLISIIIIPYELEFVNPFLLAVANAGGPGPGSWEPSLFGEVVVAELLDHLPELSF